MLTYAQGCPTLIGITSYPKVGDLPCVEYKEMVFQYLDEHPEITTVILFSRWTVWVEGTQYKQEAGTKFTLEDDWNELPENASSDLLFSTGLERTIQALIDTGHNVVLVTTIPEIGYDVPSANFIAFRTDRDLNQIIAPSTGEYLARSQRTNDILNTLANKYDLDLIEPWKILCNGGRCRVTLNNIPLYKDTNHLSFLGSEFISPAFDEYFLGSVK